MWWAFGPDLVVSEVTPRTAFAGMRQRVIGRAIATDADQVADRLVQLLYFALVGPGQAPCHDDLVVHVELDVRASRVGEPVQCQVCRPWCAIGFDPPPHGRRAHIECFSHCLDGWPAKLQEHFLYARQLFGKSFQHARSFMKRLRFEL